MPITFNTTSKRRGRGLFAPGCAPFGCGVKSDWRYYLTGPGDFYLLLSLKKESIILSFLLLFRISQPLTTSHVLV